jgi:predicted metal-dependent HD superfamily phosphohydrolase
MATILQERLWPRWLALVHVLGGDEMSARSLFADLVERYSEAGRYYHTLEHVEAMLDTLTSLGVCCEIEPVLYLAVWFHDVIYDTHAADNEERSAAYARAVLSLQAYPQALVSGTERLILLTKTHRAAPNDRTGRLLLDADLAILGADPDVYDWYARSIRKEYAWVSDGRYQAGRLAVLESFLTRTRLYHFEGLFDRAEQQARANLRREMNVLRG